MTKATTQKENLQTDQAQYIVGLTGGIASGKTSVSNLFRDLGVLTVDMDIVAREVVAPGTQALEKICQHFGSDLLQEDSTLNRAKLRKIIFSQPKKKAWLEELLHPLIRTATFEQLSQAQSPYSILVAPLMIETGLHEKMDRILIIDTSETQQIIRTVTRDQITEKEAEAIIHQQLNRNERLSHAHDVIENNTNMTDLTSDIEQLHKDYTRYAAYKRKKLTAPTPTTPKS